MESGIVGWINTYYQYALLIAGTYVLLRSLSSLHLSYSSQIIPLIVTSIAAWGVNIFYALDLIPAKWPIAPISYMAFGLGVSWSLSRHHFLDIVPVARTAWGERMHDALFVLDTPLRIVDINPAGQQFLECPARELMGQSIAQVLPQLGEIFQSDVQCDTFVGN